MSSLKIGHFEVDRLKLSESGPPKFWLSPKQLNKMWAVFNMAICHDSFHTIFTVIIENLYP